MVGEKVAIVTDKPQTTRNRIRAVLNREDAQVVFIDTPGLHKPKHRLGANMVRAARSTLKEVDVICFLVEAHLPPGKGDRYICELFENLDTPVFLVLNKVDLLNTGRQKNFADLYRALYNFKAVFPLSALKNRGLAPLVDAIVDLLPAGPRYYPPDMVTDQPERLIVAEIIREKIIELTREEIPFSVAVVVEEMSLRPDKDLIDIRAEIFVERESQGGIVIGKGGQLLKTVGIRARQELEPLLGRQVFLDLWVKVKRDWRNRERSLRDFGYDQI